MGRSEGSVLRDLRGARRRRHYQAVDIWDALYRVYIVALFGSMGVAALAGYVGRNPATGATLTRVIDHGPAAVGVGIAAVVALGIRSGARGGPIALAPADVHVVLLAPVSRARALLDPALRQVRFATFAGAVLGALGGVVLSRRLPGGGGAWVVAGTACGAATGIAAVGAALVVSGLRGRRWGSAIAFVLLLWTAIDLAGGTATAPTTFLGQLALRPAGVDGAPGIGVAFAVVVAGAGLVLLGGTAITAAQDRAALVAQLRFAVTMQDIRTVVLLRRALARDEPRRRAWLRLRLGATHPVWRRDAQGALRWPAMRVGRLGLLGLIAGAAAAAAWHGTTVLIAVAGAALFVAALDSAEGLGQEMDLPVRRDTLPMAREQLTLQHMAVPLLVMVATAGIGAATVALASTTAGHGGLAIAIGAPTALAAALGAVCGAVLSVISEPIDPLSPDLLAVPELVASVQFLIRVCAAPGLAMAGILPVVAAQGRTGSHAAGAATASAAALIVGLAAVTGLSSRPRAGRST